MSWAGKDGEIKKTCYAERIRYSRGSPDGNQKEGCDLRILPQDDAGVPECDWDTSRQGYD